MCAPHWFVSQWTFNEHHQNYVWVAGEDSTLTKGVWSVVVCLLAGALHLWCNHIPHPNGVDADTHTSLPVTLPVPCPRHGLSGDGFVPVPPLGDTVLLPDLIPFQLVGRGAAGFAQCLHLCKYNVETSWKLFYYMEESVLLGTKPLVDSIRHFVRDPSGIFSVCHLCECRIVQWRHNSRLLLLLNWFLHIIKRTLHVGSKIWILSSRGKNNIVLATRT